MAMSFGDVALAFTGGAAMQVNKIVDEERQANQRMQERAQQMMDNLAAKQIESDYAREVDKFHGERALVSSLKAVGGPYSPQGQIVLADYYKFKLPDLVKNGTYGTLKLPEFSEAPIPMNERAETLFGSEYGEQKVAFAQRFRNKIKGAFFTESGEGIPRNVSVDERGNPDPREIVQATGISLNEPAWMLQNMEGLSPEDWKKLGKRILAEDKRDIRVVDGKLVEILPEGTDILYSGEGEEQKLKESVEVFRNKETGDVIRPSYSNGEYSLGGNVIDITNYEPVITGRSQADIDYENRNERQLADLQNRAIQVKTSIASLKRYTQLSTEQLSGLPGFLTQVRDFIGTNVRGITDAMGATQSMSLADRQDALEAAGLDTKQILESDASIYKGMTEAERIGLFYAVAGTFREMGRRDMSNADVLRAQELLAGLEGSDSRLGAVISLQNQMEARRREVNIAIYQSEGVSPDERFRAGMEIVDSNKMVRGEDYVVVNGQIGVRGPNDSIIPLEDFLVRYPQARR